MRMQQIKIFYIFVLNLEEIYEIGKTKKAFSVKLRAIQYHGCQKADLMAKNGIFWQPFGPKRLRWQYSQMTIT